MELRLLRYFLTVAKEQSFTKAAEQLHITQPTLSRQMAAFEEELGVTLFIRNGKKISLTDEGILLKRRALEILNLEERTLEELKGKEEVVEGTITIGCGEFAAVETLAKICICGISHYHWDVSWHGTGEDDQCWKFFAGRSTKAFAEGLDEDTGEKEYTMLWKQK